LTAFFATARFTAFFAAFFFVAILGSVREERGAAVQRVRVTKYQVVSATQ
jgi:hypothetical protein